MPLSRPTRHAVEIWGLRIEVAVRPVSVAIAFGNVTLQLPFQGTRQSIEEAADLGGQRQKGFRLLGRAIVLFVRDGDLCFGLYQGAVGDGEVFRNSLVELRP